MGLLKNSWNKLKNYKNEPGKNVFTINSLQLLFFICNIEVTKKCTFFH